MLRLDRGKLTKLMAARGLSLARLAATSGVSRQSIYNMLSGRSVLSTPLEKILMALAADVDEVVSKAPGPREVFRRAPDRVQAAFAILREYALQHGASLFLIGSRARGTRGRAGSDWDFALQFPSGKRPGDFVSVKNRAIDAAFPYPVDVVDLSASPEWFLKSIEGGAVLLAGQIPLRGGRRTA